MQLLRILTIILILLTFGIVFIVFPALPDEIPTHWNIQGEVDGTMPVFPGTILIPALMVGITLLMIILPRYDPRWEAYREFQGAYDGLILLLNIFFFLLFLITILWALGIEVPMNQVISVLFAILMGGIAFFIRQVKPNWFAGIRTPWTMESDAVWKATHERGFRVFLIVALLCLLGILVPEYAYLFILLPVIIGTIYLVVYSYIIWKKEKAV
ncbi:SdpI family protein [Methanospirillum hungatei]|uniref:SdpI family protein n=1 Tax=Methanospirillum hungatei TaxID=2203 RepID=UPI0026EE6A54|nr:SdpI family protein [Methanospirillum hungatei]MCA1915206.1 SdpI family protein [Methanospirillum hungatei]